MKVKYHHMILTVTVESNTSKDLLLFLQDESYHKRIILEELRNCQLIARLLDVS